VCSARAVGGIFCLQTARLLSGHCVLHAGAGQAQRSALATGAGAEARLSQMDEMSADTATTVSSHSPSSAAAVKGPASIPAPSAPASAAEVSPTAASISASVASALIMQLGMPRAAPQKGASAAPTSAKKACTAGASSFSDVLAQRSTGGDDPSSGSWEGVSSDLVQMYVPCCPRCCLPACRPLFCGRVYAFHVLPRDPACLETRLAPTVLRARVCLPCSRATRFPENSCQ